MTERTRKLFRVTQFFAAACLFFAAAAMLFAPLSSFAQANQPNQADRAGQAAASPQPAKADRWLHVRVESSNPQGERVRVNVPLDLAEKVLGTVKHDHLRNGKVRINLSDEKNGVDIRALLDAVRTTKDGEFVTVQSNDEDVRVAKEAGYLHVRVYNKHSDKKDRVEVRVPMKVVDALLSAGKDELDIVAALRVLASQGDTELVSVKDSENTVRVWLDSKNSSD
jgi:multidrug efflux pump subunit AcrA (membrane-fusion protein)